MPRLLLALAVLIGLLAPTAAYAANDVTEVRTVTAKSPYRKAVFIKTEVEACSGSLVGRNLVLTAAHCVADDGRVRASINVWVGRYRDTSGAGKVRYVLRCTGHRVWVASKSPLKWSPDDWGFLSVKSCRYQSGMALHPDRQPGDVVGYHGYATYAARDQKVNQLYTGYPTTKGVRGRLFRVVGLSQDAPEMKVCVTLSCYRFAKLEAVIRSGGSGGPLLEFVGPDTYRVIAVNHARTDGSRWSHFLELNEGMVTKLNAARAGTFPAGTVTR